MSHRDAVAIRQTDSIACLDRLTIDGSQVFVFIVAQMIISSESNMIKKQKDVCDIRI